jgi:hypothetical protein
LKPNEIGYLRISNFKQDGAVANAKELTILEVTSQANITHQN